VDRVTAAERASQIENRLEQAGRFDDLNDRYLFEVLVLDDLHNGKVRQVLDELMRDAYGILRALLDSGEIFSRSAHFGRPVERTSISWLDDEVAHEITIEMLFSGLELARQALREGSWRPNRGASLRTYFVNSCILCFPNAYRKAVTRESRWNADPVDVSELNQFLGERNEVRRGPATGARERDEVVRILAHVPVEMRQVLWYLAEGYSANEIATQLGTSQRAVESKIYRFRAQLRAHHAS
jgi:DNA-directed RNA polymerase specialized sigma24 family protein